MEETITITKKQFNDAFVDVIVELTKGHPEWVNSPAIDAFAAITELIKRKLFNYQVNEEN